MDIQYPSRFLIVSAPVNLGRKQKWTDADETEFLPLETWFLSYASGKRSSFLRDGLPPLP